MSLYARLERNTLYIYWLESCVSKCDMYFVTNVLSPLV
jgi:hypothetical protein